MNVKNSLLAALGVASVLAIANVGCGAAPPAPPATPDAQTASAAVPSAADGDGDGVPDAVDKCPTKKEDGLAPDPKDGCPKGG